MDSILPGEVVVVGTADSKRNAPWGELLSTAARARGARGVVVDGLVRDVKKIESLEDFRSSRPGSSLSTRRDEGFPGLQSTFGVRWYPCLAPGRGICRL